MNFAFVSGFSLGFSLILAIGAQNAFVLRQGIRGEHVFAVALTCALSDAILIAIGVVGADVIIGAIPNFANWMRWAGAIFLFGYGAYFSFRSALPSMTRDFPTADRLIGLVGHGRGFTGSGRPGPVSGGPGGQDYSCRLSRPRPCNQVLHFPPDPVYLPGRRTGPIGAACQCCRSSGVEHSLGKGEAESSILSGSTSESPEKSIFCAVVIKRLSMGIVEGGLHGK